MLVSAHIVDIALMGSTSPNQRVKILPPTCAINLQCYMLICLVYAYTVHICGSSGWKLNIISLRTLPCSKRCSTELALRVGLMHAV